MKVVSDDGEEMEYGRGLRHDGTQPDAWILGDEPCVVIDWQGFTEYASPDCPTTATGQRLRDSPPDSSSEEARSPRTAGTEDSHQTEEPTR